MMKNFINVQLNKISDKIYKSYMKHIFVLYKVLFFKANYESDKLYYSNV